MQHKPSYIVFARYPELHKAKTRLVPTLGAENTLRLYTAMMLDIVEKVLQRNTQLLLCVTPLQRIGDFVEFLASEGMYSAQLLVVAQQGNTLGDRMHHAFCQAYHRTAQPALILGTDSPTLPDDYLQQAEDLVCASENNVVLGASEDGGFYTMGLTQPNPHYFLGDNYSNATVYRRTWAAIEQHGATPVALPLWYDVDDKESMKRLCSEVAVGVQTHSPRTSAVVQSVAHLV